MNELFWLSLMLLIFSLSWKCVGLHQELAAANWNKRHQDRRIESLLSQLEAADCRDDRIYKDLNKAWKVQNQMAEQARQWKERCRELISKRKTP
jgi:hypothetical protein